MVRKMQVQGFPDYWIYEDGRLWSDFTKRFLLEFEIGRKNKEGIKGYRAFKVCKDCFEKTYQVHRLVATHFIPNPENKPQVNHKDGNKGNNHVDNLEWVTQKENITHAWETGLITTAERTGVKHSRATYTEEEVRGFCLQFQAGLKPLDVVARAFSKEYHKVYRIWARDNWTSISKDYTW